MLGKHEIWTEDFYQAAKMRIAQLAGCLENTPEEAELIDLVRAVQVWDARHDDTAAWMD